MTLPFYASPEQLMRDKSEYARKGIARGRSVVVLAYAGGVLFVAENHSTTLHKVSEIYDRIGFAAVGRYSEFENLRQAGIRFADIRGYSYDRRDVTGRQIANTYAQALGVIFTEQPKPYEVELCIAEVGETAAEDQLYRVTYDGSVGDEPDFVVMGGQAETITTALRQAYQPDMDLAAAIATAVKALRAGNSGNGGEQRELGVEQLEVAVLDRARPRRAFRRIRGAALKSLLSGGDGGDGAADKEGADSADKAGEAGGKAAKAGGADESGETASSASPESSDKPAEDGGSTGS
ncbi:proteasome alpha subunit [Streptoalloteichus tenebrarius]|uniref:Proteasome subunit alpha n=1 Tax=Streptoalloteichus tenebrarius (strain ATCC 17920 / DSM 40477 / JCM 4838 / CBS 697.72 / NBRC 16177 / NCIMB 11028 / NRRL B-12390 / A12253. 1 / ISP 5477) TaxID=1933 RepID=A0ABT1HP84_STRSD|nr:proteasome subunit alpha [Streptoalloteichus tenebrarius]MCP2257322.1 proteasome alpha subunit [Streptoalloteichus tenebrarius]BFF04231.1 proteasome subunit alpha [Streptoalloteichus tenebrarius]